MRRRLVIAFTLVALAPLVLLAWTGARIVRGEREAVRERMRELLSDRLRDAETRFLALMDARERELLRSTDDLVLETAALRDWLRRTPVASQVFVLDPDGRRSHPPADGPLADGERSFLERAAPLWHQTHRFFQAPDPSSSNAPASAPTQGWYVWYWGSGLQVLFWRRLPSGSVVGVELSRARLLADLIASLPDEGSSRRGRPAREGDIVGRIRWVDSRGETLYEWGPYTPPEGAEPEVSLQLAAPLSGWRLEYLASPELTGGMLSRSLGLQVVLGLGAVGVALAGLAVYVIRESARELREAAQRVSFVNQVSHELKTPLTNIRLYGELLAERMPEGDEESARYAGVIVSECQRLSRLIGNILTFAGSRRGKLRLHVRPGVIDDTIRAALSHQKASLEARGVHVDFRAGAPARARFDPDALEQILTNLFSNVEKYASSGGRLEVESRQDPGRTTILVRDGGPGIPPKDRETVFLPFHRLGDALHEGTSGTGIGLSIARELARMHDGDVRVLPSERGALLEVTLRTPTDDEGTGR